MCGEKCAVYRGPVCICEVFVLAPRHANGAVFCMHVLVDEPRLSASGRASSRSIMYHISRPHASPRCRSHANFRSSEIEKGAS